MKGRTPSGEEVALAEGVAGEYTDVDATSNEMQSVTALTVSSSGVDTDLPDIPGSQICVNIYTYAWDFFVTDHLGTVRAIYGAAKDASGAVTTTVKAWKDYEPYGFELFEQTMQEATNTRFEFAGHQRDERADGFDADYMSFRFYGASIGRFMRPDNVNGSPMNPQDWNLYAYVNGNPVNFNDPTGHEGSTQEQQAAKAPITTPSVLGSGTPVTEEKQKQQGYNPGKAEGQKQAKEDEKKKEQEKLEQKKDEPEATAAGGQGRKGGQGKGERGKAARPDGTGNEKKHVQECPDEPGRYRVWDKHKGDWVKKSRGWKPTSETSLLESAVVATVVTTAVVGLRILQAVVEGASKAAMVTTGVGLLVITPANLPDRPMTEAEKLAGTA